MTPSTKVVLALAIVGGFAACGEEVAIPPDDLAPTSLARLSFPTGGSIEVKLATVNVNTVDVRLLLEASEPAVIHYTSDGSEPVAGAEGTSEAASPTFFTVTDTATYRWYAVDLAGNEEHEKHSVQLRFDREAPELFVEPVGGVFAGPVVVQVSSNEMVDLLYTTDGTLPRESSESTERVSLPAEFELRKTTTLNLLLLDEAGNATPETFTYIIDSQAPTTRADPPGGRFLAPVSVVLTTDDESAQIQYTLDGQNPDGDSPVYSGPIRVAEDAELRFRGVDDGGNAEATQSLSFTVGPRYPRAPSYGEDRQRFDNAGGLHLATVLMEAAGPLSKREDARAHRVDYLAWATGRAAADALLFRSGVGPHVLHSEGIKAVATGGEGSADDNENGTNLDETWWARVLQLADRAGTTPPDGLHPVGMFYRAGQASLLQRPPERRLADGRPVSEEDYAHMRWAGSGATDRVVTVEAQAAGLRALVARARAALVKHPQGEGDFGTQVVEVLGLRCGGCHREGGVTPRLREASDYAEAGLWTAGEADARVLDLLSGAEVHFPDPAPEGQVDLVAEWIAAGAEAGETSPAPGPTGREGLVALLAADSLGLTLSNSVERLIFDPESGRLGPLVVGTEGQFVVAAADATEGPAPGGLPRRIDQLLVIDPAFTTGPQAAFAGALIELLRFIEASGALFDTPPLAGSPSLPRAQSFATDLLRVTLDALFAHVWREGAVRESWRGTTDVSQRVDTAAMADVAATFIRAEGVGGLVLEDRASELMGKLGALRTEAGDYLEGGTVQTGPDYDARRTLRTQLAVLRALALRAEAHAGAADDARALWARLEALWWDSDAGAWQTTLGIDRYEYDPALAARVVEVLALLDESDLVDEAGDRLSTFVEGTVVGRMLLTETWMTGEIGAGPDADGDGIPRPEGHSGEGAPPVFVGSVSF